MGRWFGGRGMDSLADLLIRDDIPADVRRVIQSHLASTPQSSRLERIVGALDDLIFELSATGVFVGYHQPGRSASLLIPPEEFIGRHYSEVLPPDPAEQLEAALEGLARTGRSQDFDYSLELNGQVRWFNARASRMEGNPNQGAASVVVSVREVTDRVADEATLTRRGFLLEEQLAGEAARLAAANEELRREIHTRRKAEARAVEVREFHENILESIGDGVLVTDASDTITYANSAMAEILCLGKDRVMGCRLASSTSEPALLALLHHYLEARRELQAISFEELPVTGPGGVARYLSGALIPLTVDSGFAGMVVSARDVTSRRRAQQRLRAQGELARGVLAAETLQEALDLCLATALTLAGLDCGGIYVVDEVTGDLHLRAHRNLDDPFVEAVAHIRADDPRAELVRRGKPTYKGIGEFDPANADDIADEGLSVVAIVPVTYRGQVIACLNGSTHVMAEISEGKRRALQTVASQIASVLARFRAEDRLRTTEERYRLVLEATNDGIWDIYPRTHEVYWSPRVWRMLGYEFATQEEALRHWDSIVHPDDLAEAARLMYGMVDGTVDRYEVIFRARTPSGEERYILSRGKMVEAGDPVRGPRLAGTNADITERVRAERALARSELIYRTTIDALDDLVYVSDPDFRIVLVNAAYDRWQVELDLPCESPTGKKVLEAFPFLPPEVLSEYRQVIDTAAPLLTHETTQVGPLAIETETRKLPVLEGGKVVRVVCMVRRLSEERRPG
ncbi:MAG: PAS domain S-box protein [Armatimonadia bacterium]|nr:PAS domain S-box protein [Armatimonadia bacterium]